MFVRKELLAQVPTREYRKELAYLRARRRALDSLIRSLEGYVRYLPKKSAKTQDAA